MKYSSMIKELLKKCWLICVPYILLNIGLSFGIICNTSARTSLVDSFTSKSSDINEVLFYLIQNLIVVFVFVYLLPFLISFVEKNLHKLFSIVVSKAINFKKTYIPYAFFENSKINDVISLINDADINLFSFFRSCLEIIVALNQLIFCFLVLKDVGIINLIILVLFFVPVIFFSIYSASKYYDTWAKTAKLRRHCDYQRDVLTAKEYSLERILFDFSHFFKEKWRKEYNKVRSASIKEELKGSIRIQICGIIFCIYIVFFLIILLKNLVDGTITIGFFVSVISIIPMMLSNIIDNIAQNINIIIKSQKTVTKMKEFFNLSEESTCDDVVSDGTFQRIEFKNVSFKYPNSDRLVLENINLKLEHGKKYTIVGENGAGKTTLVNLLLGLYEPVSGEILIDGRNLSTYKHSDLHKLISPLLQNPQKFSLSVFENIGVGNIDTIQQPEKIREAIEKVKASVLVDKLKYKYNTILDSSLENGQSLSGGEWQKIFLARLFVSEASMYILDEPSSSLDPVYENWLASNFYEMIKEKTCLIISHRLVFSKKSDEIIVVENGKICEKGNHVELIEKKGLYYKMYTAQESMYNEGEYNE